jgi:DNA modification methylase
VIDIAHSGHYVGDCRELLRELPDGCVQTCITSPPYWGLRDYGVDGQLGLEASPEEYVERIVEVFRDVRRVLRDDGTLWLNLGDCYAHDNRGSTVGVNSTINAEDQHVEAQRAFNRRGGKPAGYKHKDLIGQPWMVAFALRVDGWYLRADIIWHKLNPQPESVTDRPTKTHEYLFLLSKSERYYYNAAAIREPVTGGAKPRGHGVNPKAEANAAGSRQNASFSRATSSYKSGNKSRSNRADHGGISDHNARQGFGVPWEDTDGFRNRRSVWTTISEPYKGAHFATFPPALIEPCVLAGSRVGDIVLDPFFGSGTTGAVAEKHGRRWIGFDLNPEYEKLQKERTAQRSLVFGEVKP